MDNPYRPWTPKDQQWTTSFRARMAFDRCDQVDAFQEDTQETAREAALQCRACYYLFADRIGGAAMTTWYCGLCGTEGLHGSTATPRLCDNCARTHELCRECGGDIKMRTRRKRPWPEPVPR